MSCETGRCETGRCGTGRCGTGRCGTEDYKMIDVGHVKDNSVPYYYLVGIDADEIIYSITRSISVTENDNNVIIMKI